MIWTNFDDVYQATMSNSWLPYFYKDNKLYLITSWSMGTTMFGATKENESTNKAEGKELIDYGNQ